MRKTVITYKERLIETIIETNNFIWLGVVLFFTAIGMPWFALIVWYCVLFIFLYFSYRRAVFYLFNVIDKEEFIELHFYIKNSYKCHIIKKKSIKIDYVDSGAYNIKIYHDSKLLVKQYAVGEWTRERLSKFYENYCKEKIEIPK